MRASTVALLLALQQQQAASFVCVPGGALRPSPSDVRYDARTGTGSNTGTGTGTGRGGFGVMGRGAAVTADVPARPSTTRVRSQDSPATGEDDGAAAAEEEENAFAKRLDSLKASDLLGGGSDLLGGGGDLLGEGGDLLGGSGGGGVAAAGEGAVADLGEPGKLVREAVKPFQEEMDRIEADFEKSIQDNTDDMERRLAEIMKKMDGED